jgi:hypothetical protein
MDERLRFVPRLLDGSAVCTYLLPIEATVFVTFNQIKKFFY